MKHLFAIVLVVVGILAALLGILFLIGAAGQTGRYLVSLASLVTAAVTLGFGLLLFRQAKRLDPELIRAEILELAQKKNGELSQQDIQALLAKRFDAAAPVLLQMQQRGVCQMASKDGVTYYNFLSLQPRLTIRRCEFCQAELPLAATLVSCPQCGGTVTTEVQQVSLSNSKLYGMDE